jgi:hypothetical protein
MQLRTNYGTARDTCQSYFERKNSRNGLSAETKLPKRLGKNITPTHWTSDHPTHSVRVTVATFTAAKSVRLLVEIVHILHNRCRGIYRSFFMRVNICFETGTV